MKKSEFLREEYVKGLKKAQRLIERMIATSEENTYTDWSDFLEMASQYADTAQTHPETGEKVYGFSDCEGSDVDYLLEESDEDCFIEGTINDNEIVAKFKDEEGKPYTFRALV